jgi:hypothetical protein
MMGEWCALDEAVVQGGLAEIMGWPWESPNPSVQAAWESLTRPEHLADLEYRLACHDDMSRRMHDWAETVTRKAVEVGRSRAGVGP